MTTIKKPTLLVDEKKCRENIRMMAHKAAKNGLIFRPHFKTHQSLEVGQWFREYGVTAITVSSVEMAQKFSRQYNDITIAFPVNVHEMEDINHLAGQLKLNLLVEGVETASHLKKHLKQNAGYFIKIDVGSHRTGVDPSNIRLIENILEEAELSSHLTFKGFLSHAGHTYQCRAKQDVLNIHNESRHIMGMLKQQFISRYPDLIISLGDTPGCCMAEDFGGVDEIRPGNFVYFDLTQVAIGAADYDQVAVALKCPVVAVHKSRKELVIYGGGVHFSKEALQDPILGDVFGQAMKEKDDNTWGVAIDGMIVRRLSQEHGVVGLPDALADKVQPGDLLTILPVHSCMTVSCMQNHVVV